MTKDKVQKIFSQNLKTLLDMKNATQLELAKYLGVSNTTINNYVKGYNMPRMDKVDDIARFFNVSREDLISSKSIYTQNERKLISVYRDANSMGQKKIMESAIDMSNLYPKEPTREEMEFYLKDFQYAAYGGAKALNKMSDDELKTLYRLAKQMEE